MHLDRERIAQPYIGKWIRQSAVVSDLIISGDVVMIRHEYFTETAMSREFRFSFSPQWRDRIAMFTKGTEIRVIGKIENVYSFGLDLVDCELVS